MHDTRCGNQCRLLTLSCTACAAKAAHAPFTCHICEPAVLTWWRLVVFLLHCICGRGSARILAAWPHGVDCNDCPHRLAPAPLPLHGLCMRTEHDCWSS